MKQKILNIITILALTIMPAGIFASTSYAAAPSCGSATSSKGQVLQGVGQTGGDCTDTGVTNAISGAVQVLSVVIGIAAVIMIMISGFKYITSGGDTAKVGSAKNSLIYALVGVAVAALAQVMIHYVINSTKISTAKCPTDSSILVSDAACKT